MDGKSGEKGRKMQEELKKDLEKMFENMVNQELKEIAIEEMPETIREE